MATVIIILAFLVRVGAASVRGLAIIMPAATVTRWIPPRAAAVVSDDEGGEENDGEHKDKAIN